ncbi:MAG: ATP-binding protein [Candidatus Omnitrophota bacterium]
MLFYFNNLAFFAPNVALAVLSSFYALLGLLFVSFPMEDRDNLAKRRIRSLPVSHLFWFVFPIAAFMITIIPLAIVTLLMSQNTTPDIQRAWEMLPSYFKLPLFMIGIWLAAILVFLAGFIAAQLFLMWRNYLQLQTAQSQLIRSEKLASLGQLVGGIAHEINNPINFILSNIEPLKEYLQSYKRLDAYIASQKTKLPSTLQTDIEALRQDADLDFAGEDSEKILESFQEGSKRISKIVEALRQYSRIDKDYYSSYDLRESVDSALALLANRMKNRIEIHKNYEEIPAIRCSPAQIDQVFFHILRNADQAIAEKGHIWIDIRSEENSIIVTIRDDGKGIAPEHLSKIFDPFFTTQPIGGGTGLGLSLSQGIIEQHGGTLSVESELGKGSAFTVSLPIRQERQAD